MDIQPVFNNYKTVAYMCAYFSESENECSVAMKQVVRDAFKKELNNYEPMKLVANATLIKRNVVFRSVSIIFYQVSGREKHFHV